MIHPNTELRFISDAVGYGVVATAFIPKGTITWVKDRLDRTFRPEQVQSLGKHYAELLEKYCYRDREGQYVLCWDIARFVNHSFNSSCLTTAYEFELAVRDIHPGEELTDDYGYLNISEPFDCEPEAGIDRTTVFPDDILRYYPIWDKKVLDAFRQFNSVDQPLNLFMEPAVWQTATQIGAGTREMDSLLNCYFDPRRSA